jgi:hypothetical protein
MNKTEFLAFLASTEGRTALASAVWNTDNVIAAPGSPKPGKNADGTDVNTHWAGTPYLQSIYGVSVQALEALKKDVNINEDAIANAILANPAFVNGFVAAVAAKLPPGVQASPEQLATAFKTALREGVAA